MPVIAANGTELYYETYGPDYPDRAPVVLIHGSTNTGAAEWGSIAPLLARDYRVIVPDCRGHGRSLNPQHSYSFRQMADDIAALIRALGYERAHIIGHSNGGNVALVTLLEHPEVVQSAVLQAANAYVSADLHQREPRVFDPERIAREDPAWMQSLTTLHTALGPEYWRELLRLTLQEILSAPNYSAADLSQVRRPALVIQGEQDAVNAPAQHAQFIARAIPEAELWLPATGHNVHLEKPLQWIERVLDFLARRGDDANDALYRLKRARFADEREMVFAVCVQAGSLEGRVLSAAQRTAALEALASVTAAPLADHLTILLHDATPWALVNRAVTDMRRAPDNHVERLSQARMGEAVRVLEERGEWAFVQTSHDGYLGWVHSAALWRGPAEAVQAYQAAATVWVATPIAWLYSAPAVDAPLLGRLPLGVILPQVVRESGFTAVRLPDGRVGWVLAELLIPLAERPSPDAAGIAVALGHIRHLMGVPYLWGGRTPFGIDCSGLAQTFYALMGVRLPRDADQQFRAGQPVEGMPQPGDLLFFGEPGERGARGPRITHVAIALGDNAFIHATGATWCVTCNSLDPQAPNYLAWLREHWMGTRRFICN